MLGLKLPFLNTKQEKKDYFLALLLKSDRISAILFEEQNSKLNILSTKEEEIHTEINNLDQEDLIDTSDKVISAVETVLPQNITVNKTIFAVPYDWIEQGKINKEHLGKLKKLCEELEITPMGFIVPIEAIIHFLQEKEGAPISSIFIEITKHNVTAYVVRAGNIIEIKKSEAKEKIIDVVENILKKVEKFEVLPSKMILLDYEGAEGIQQKFLSHPWTKELPFLHLPQIAILEKGSENEAVISGVATQMRFEVFQDLKAPREEEVVQSKKLSKGEDFGFFKDKDVALKIEKDDKTLKKEDLEEKNNEEIFETVEEKIENEEIMEVEEDEEVIEEFEKTNIKISGSYSKTEKGKNPIKTFKFPSILKQALSFKNLKLPKLGFHLPLKSNLIIFLFLGALAVISIFIVYYSFLLKADVVLFAENKNFDKEIKVVFAQDSPTLFSDSKKILNIISSSQEIEGDKEKETVGKKDTGEKAKGEVVVYNKTDKSKTFAKGTMIGTQNGLKFQLVGDINIASTSVFSITPTSGKVKVEATKFGQEYNLPSNTNFIFEDYPTSSFIAKNDIAFSGGTKKTIQVVSQKDLDELESSLVSDLKDKVILDTSREDSEDVILPSILDYDFIEKDFSHKKDEEADSVKLSGKINFKLGFYKKPDMEELIGQLSKETIPTNYSLVKEELNIDIKDLKTNKDKSINANLNIKATFAPNIDIKNLKAELKGKSTKDAQTYLQKISGLSDFKIIYKNKLPFLPEILPKNPQNINLTIKTNV